MILLVNLTLLDLALQANLVSYASKVADPMLIISGSRYAVYSGRELLLPTAKIVQHHPMLTVYGDLRTLKRSVLSSHRAAVVIVPI